MAKKCDLLPCQQRDWEALVFWIFKIHCSGFPPGGVRGGGEGGSLLAKKLQIYSIFCCHSSQNRSFSALKLKILKKKFTKGEDPPLFVPPPLSNIPGGNPVVILCRKEVPAFLNNILLICVHSLLIYHWRGSGHLNLFITNCHIFVQNYFQQHANMTKPMPYLF